MRKVIGAAAVGVILASVGCASSSGNSKAGPELSHEEKIAKQLAAKKTPMAAMGWMIGTWEQTDTNGQKQELVSYRATANNTAICETLFAGTPHEMVTMYYIEEGQLKMTHFCAAGNQPQLESKPSNDPNVTIFELDEVETDSKDESYMGRLVITRIDNDHVREEWTSFQNGKRTEGVVFELSRKK